jgi:hypothetical protein
VKTIAGISQELLQVEKVGVDDSFFKLGGHSLLIVQAHHRLSDVADRGLSITDMFRYPTVRALKQYPSQEPNDRDPESTQRTLDRARTRRQTMMQRRKRSQRSSM